MKFNKDMTIKEALEVDPKSAEIFFSHGMHCIGCPTASAERIEEAAIAHGIDVDSLLDHLNAL